MPDEVELDTEIMRTLNRLRMTGKYCDVVLATEDGGMFRVHKAAMCWCSSYFRTVFTTSLADLTSGDKSKTRNFILIPNVSASILETIIHYAYSGKTLVNEDNVNELLPAADQFDVEGMVDYCTKFLLKSLSAENCLGIWRFGKDYFIKSLEQEAFRFVLNHFPAVVETSEEFFELSDSSLKCILKEDTLNTKKELPVWKSIRRWCDYKLTERLPYIPTLLQCVRLAVMPIKDFQEVIDDDKVKNYECGVFTSLVAKYILGKEIKFLSASEFQKVEPLFIPRLPHDVLFCLGGWSLSGPTNLLEVYDCRIDNWKLVELEHSIWPRVYHKCISYAHYIYVLGGSEGFSCLNTCLRFDTLAKKFEEVSPMHERRCYLSAVLLSDKIYAIGGYNGDDRLGTVEEYNIQLNQVLEGKIYVIGGYDDVAELPTQECECFDPSIQRWQRTAPLSIGRSGLSVCIQSGLRNIEDYIVDKITRCRLKDPIIINHEKE
ncbi:kelch-like protein 10 isoform X2 [Stegodyphus dumicola]|uniref:kelch-like protein 10 isoform X2 n=1 Tax=Stegodyphus dumicola TaxID=202533 RepID=UPI0015B332F7|nr:kelch-like protein 10 isoform X2 [Stegodyphus dumicola]